MSRLERIQDTLKSALSPMHLEVVDESHMHSVPDGAESHFKVVAISDCFAALKPVGRHRLITKSLQGEFDRGLHALAIHAWTVEEWFEMGGRVPDSPPCLGGSKTD